MSVAPAGSVTVELPCRQILGVKFFLGTASEAVARMLETGGFLVAPSAPGMVRLRDDEPYRDAMLHADLAIADSGLMALIWRVVGKGSVDRISGLNFLENLLARPELRLPGAVFCILPNENAKHKTLAWSAAAGFAITEEDCSIAPFYEASITDEALIAIINRRRPAHVLIGIGSGPQEKLGYYLREHLSYRPAFYCIGAALGFITGDQTAIPVWADRLYLGWLLRIISAPTLYLPRFARALELPKLIWKYRDRLPPLVPEL
jgi:N-acetylglucosaminyldiphosphoundecaprenol N-acetyl-beta-D-mannosaminyltransferase